MSRKHTVDVKSAWQSKINGLAALGALIASFVGSNALGLDQSTQVKVLAITQFVVSAGAIVLRTFFTRSITPNSI